MSSSSRDSTPMRGTESPTQAETHFIRTIDSGVVDLTVKSAKTFLAVALVYFMGYYRFSSAWILVGLIVYVMRGKYQREKSFKMDIAKQASINEKASILARVLDLPSWVYFPDTERAEWVNKIFHQLWPNVGHYVKDFLTEHIEPSMRETVKQTTKFGNFKFDKIDLGVIPIRIGGIKVYKEQVSRHEIIMDIEIFYAGDCDIQVLISKLKAGVRDLQLHGTLRVIFKPLIDQMPLVGGMQVFFLNTPIIDFNLTNVADVLDLPGISDMLHKIVIEQISNLMVLPNKLTIKLSDTVPSKVLRFTEPAGVLRINVVEAKDLMKKDVVMGFGKSDPYGIISVGAQEFRTKTINNTINPVWDFYCEALVECVEGQSVILALFDKDQGNDDDPLGRLSVDIQRIASKGFTDTWIPLEEAKTGQVHLKIYWLGLSMNALDLDAQQKELLTLKELGLSTAVLLAYVDSAKSLPLPSKAPVEPNPFVRLTVGCQKFETAAQKMTLDPIWEEGFSFNVANPEVLDSRSQKSLGHMTYAIGSLLHMDQLEVTRPFSLKGSGPQSKIYLTLKLRILKSGVIVPLDIRGEDPTTDSLNNRSRSGSDSPANSARSSPAHCNNSTPEIPPSTPDSAHEISKTDFSDSVDVKENDNLRHRKITSSPSNESASGSFLGVGKIQLTLRYSQQRTRLVIVIHKAMDLPQLEGDPPDPYVKLYLQPDKNRDSKRKTQVLKNTCNPVYDETFDYVINQNDLHNFQLLVTVNNRSSSVFSKTSVIGQTYVDLSLLDLSKATTAWYSLVPETNQN
uniref:Extended synaptotagmin-2 n=1 Tax=Strigamia maritima TaxID=126957 RepID=T1J7Z1_STRMM